jgi:hypothetical protein
MKIFLFTNLLVFLILVGSSNSSFALFLSCTKSTYVTNTSTGKIEGMPTKGISLVISDAEKSVIFNGRPMKTILYNKKFIIFSTQTELANTKYTLDRISGFFNQTLYCQKAKLKF